MARQLKARKGKERQGNTMLGKAPQCNAWQGKVRQG
jgi:hypothetical protein